MTPSSADTPAASAPPPAAPVRSRRPAIAAIATLALLLVGLLVYEFDARDRGTDDAYVTGHLHVISPRVAGTVERVLVDDNQFVHAGDALVQIDRRDFDVRVAAQRARVAQAHADASRAHALIEQADAALVSAHADAEKAELDYARARELTRETPRGLSKQEFDAADAARKSARARVAVADAQRRSAVAAAEAADAAASQNDAELRALLQLGYTAVVAPSDGYVGKKTVETGEHVAPGGAAHAGRAAPLDRREFPRDAASPRARRRRRAIALRCAAAACSPAASTACRPRRAPSSHCCRPTMRPAISRRSRSAS